MANNVMITLTVIAPTAEELNAFVEASKSICEESGKPVPFSFDNHIPMPKALKNVPKTRDPFIPAIGYAAWHGDYPSNALAHGWILDSGVKTREELQELLQKTNPEYKIHADLMHKNLIETGFISAYTWRLENWGVKDEPYFFEEMPAPEENSVQIRFCTAWGFPGAAFKTITEKYPHLTMYGDYIEDMNSFEGEFDYSPGGELSIEAWEIEHDDDEDDEELD